MIAPHNTSFITAAVQSAISAAKSYLEDDDSPDNFNSDKAWEVYSNRGSTVLRNVDDSNGDIVKNLFINTCLNIIETNADLNEVESGDYEDEDEDE